MHRAFALVYLAAVALKAGYAQDVARPAGNRGVSEILVPGKGWELLGEGYQLTADSAVDGEGNIYFTDAQKDRILKIDLKGKISLWKDGSHDSHGIVYGPDGRLYAGQHDFKRIVAFSADGTESVLAEGLQTHHLTVTARNDIYFTEAPAHKVWLLDAKGQSRVVHEGIKWPRGVRVSSDQKRLVVNDAQSKWIWSFQIQPDGSLINGRETYQLESPGGNPDADPGGMTFDSQGFLYVATKFGVQVFDRQAHLTAIIGVPASDGVSNVLFAGLGLKWLYVMEWNKVYRRPARRRGA